MKAKYILPVSLLVIIAVLGSALIYQTVQNRLAWKRHLRVDLEDSYQLYQNLDRGEQDIAKQRLGWHVIFKLEYYQKTYGEETDTNFANIVAEAAKIRASDISSTHSK